MWAVGSGNGRDSLAERKHVTSVDVTQKLQPLKKLLLRISIVFVIFLCNNSKRTTRTQEQFLSLLPLDRNIGWIRIIRIKCRALTETDQHAAIGRRPRDRYPSMFWFFVVVGAVGPIDDYKDAHHP
jgi:hypothetical protein